MAAFRNYPAQNLEGRYPRVTVLNVQNPGRIYIHLEDAEGSRTRLLHYYANTSVNHPEVRPVNEDEIYPGAPVYFRHDDKFYRAVVNEERDGEGDIPIWLGDWALAPYARKEELFTVPVEHTTIAFQAIGCGLHAIKPGQGEEWSPEICRYAQEYLEEQLWDLYVIDNDTGADAIWVHLEAHENSKESLRDRLLATGQGQWSANPEWFDWGGDGGYHCDSVQAPLRNQLIHGGNMDIDQEQDNADDDADEMEEWEDHEETGDEGYDSERATDEEEMEDVNENL